MAYDFKPFEKKIKDIEERMAHELSGIRTGRATPAILDSITVANLGLSVGMDEKGVRVFFPELTAERRTQLLKLAKEKVEEMRTSVRVARDEVWSDIQTQEREGKMPEDDKFRAKEEMQKRVDADNRQRVWNMFPAPHRGGEVRRDRILYQLAALWRVCKNLW
jgi:ribosome recycling factor